MWNNLKRNTIVKQKPEVVMVMNLYSATQS